MLTKNSMDTVKLMVADIYNIMYARPMRSKTADRLCKALPFAWSHCQAYKQYSCNAQQRLVCTAPSMTFATDGVCAPDLLVPRPRKTRHQRRDVRDNQHIEINQAQLRAGARLDESLFNPWRSKLSSLCPSTCIVMKNWWARKKNSTIYSHALYYLEYYSTVCVISRSTWNLCLPFVSPIFNAMYAYILLIVRDSLGPTATGQLCCQFHTDPRNSKNEPRSLCFVIWTWETPFSINKANLSWHSIPSSPVRCFYVVPWTV